MFLVTQIPWGSVKDVTTGLALLALIVLAVFYIWHTRITNQKKALAGLP